jgi:hypothetical protein
MSVSRLDFLRSLEGISDAVELESVAQGATGAVIAPSILILRRGILIAGLIALEAFIRNRTIELLGRFERWPSSFDDLPEKLRLASRLNALPHLEKYAKMLKRQGDDFEGEIFAELVKMSSGGQTALQFTKFVAGDYTGNVSDVGLKELLSCFQIADCWTEFRSFSSEIGIGVPSVHEIVKNTVRKRHRSAHSPGYTPTAADISELPSDLLCIGICFDASMTASVNQALSLSNKWAKGETHWRSDLSMYFAKPYGSQLRLVKSGNVRATAVVPDMEGVRAAMPLPAIGTTTILVQHDASGRPVGWDIPH